MFLENLKYILKIYTKLKLSQRIFICIRFITCPWHKLLPIITGKSSILDIGCGHGLFLNLIRKKFSDVHCVGFDHDLNKINQAKLSSEEIKFLTIDDVEKLEKSSFDFVSIIDVLYSVPVDDWDKVIKTAYNSLKPGGKLILKETVNKPVLKYYFCLMQEILAIKILRYTKGESPNLLPIDFYIQKLIKNNFTIVDHYDVSKYYLWPHYLFITEKLISK